jgi:hypothetical protein
MLVQSTNAGKLLQPIIWQDDPTRLCTKQTCFVSRSDAATFPLPQHGLRIASDCAAYFEMAAGRSTASSARLLKSLERFAEQALKHLS